MQARRPRRRAAGREPLPLPPPHLRLVAPAGRRLAVSSRAAAGLHTATAIDGIDSSHFVVVGDGGVRGAIARYRNGAWDTLRTPFLRPSVHSVDMV